MLSMCRDVIEVRMDINGVACVVSDTAGLRYNKVDNNHHKDNSNNPPPASTDVIDLIEQEGIRRAR